MPGFVPSIRSADTIPVGTGPGGDQSEMPPDTSITSPLM